MSHTKPLPERLRASADEVQSFPHPTFCDHLHVAHDVMREAAAALEAYDLGARSTAAQPAAWDGAEEWEQLAWQLCAEENGEDACTELVWEGGAIPEPWGDRWMKYEGEAKRMISLVRQFAPPAASGDSTPPSEPACETCKGVGMIGGFVNADSGYDGMPCPECSPQGDPSGAPQAEPEAVGPDCHGLDTPERVRFYEHDFYVLSNFSAFNVAQGGFMFQTAEHLYHYMKFARPWGDEDRGKPIDWSGPEILVAQAIFGATSAHEAFKIAEQNKALRRPDWDQVKVSFMRDILRAKAMQHSYVLRKLLATGDRELVEDSWRDDFWGWGPNRDGKNMLGRLWMEVRAEFRAAEPPQAASGCSHTARSDGQNGVEQGATPPAPATPPGHWDEYAMREARRLWNLPAMPKGQLVASLHCALIDAMRFAASPQPAAPVEDLAMMIRMLVSSLKRHWPHAPQPNDLPSRAMELLRRHGLQGSPLREADDGAPKQSTAAVKRDYCPEKLKPGGCQLHNLHCGYPKCNASPAAEGGAS